MSTHCISCRLESEKTCLLAKVKLHFTCINRKARCLIWTHSLIHNFTYLRKERGEEEDKKEIATLWSLVFLVFFLRACDLSLEILYSLVHCWLSILRKFSLLGFSPCGFSQGLLLLSLWLCFYQ